MKKNLLFIVLLTSILALAGCASVPTQDSTASGPQIPSLASEKVVADMQTSDRSKLQELVNTAKERDTQKWRNKDNHNDYAFTSYTIYVNVRGQACREYEVEELGLFGSKSRQIACRVTDGQWRVNKFVDDKNN